MTDTKSTAVSLPRSMGAKPVRFAPVSESPVTKSRQVADRLRDTARALAPGDRLPSVQTLARRYGVAGTTVEAAVSLLRQEGVVTSRPRSGTFVAPVGTASSASRIPGSDASQGTAVASRTLGVISFYHSPFYQMVVDCIVREADAAGLHAECHYTGLGGHLHPEVLARLEAVSPVGFLVAGPALEEVATALAAHGHPVVLVGEPYIASAPSVPVVCSDAERGGYIAARRLLDLGHRRIGYVSGFGSAADLLRRRRWLGHLRALRESGISVTESGSTADAHAFFGSDMDAWEADPALLRRLVDAPGAPTAFATWSDIDGSRLLRLLRVAGVDVPRRVSVIGYDNLLVGEHCYPPLDTVDQHQSDQVRYALSLLHLQSQPTLPQALSATLIVPTLLTRGSCAPPLRA